MSTLEERCKAFYHRVGHDMMLQRVNPVDELVKFVHDEIDNSVGSTVDLMNFIEDPTQYIFDDQFPPLMKSFLEQIQMEFERRGLR